jgi:hypothetical protein
MNISLKRIVEQQGSEQFYDLGRDFANFKRTIDGTSEQIKARFESAIGAKLNGKRIRARASRGYKQYVKDYEFDVSKITLDDYYDNYVVVAHDNSTPKAKEYFLKPGFKIDVIGPATGQPSPQKGDKPGDQKPAAPQSPTQAPPSPEPMAQHTLMAQAPAGNTKGELAEEEDASKNSANAYPIDSISKDIKAWLPRFLLKPETTLRDFINGLGWMQNTGNKTISVYDLKVPAVSLKAKIDKEVLTRIFGELQLETPGTIYNVMSVKPNEANDEVSIRIKKTTSK